MASTGVIFKIIDRMAGPPPSIKIQQWRRGSNPSQKTKVLSLDIPGFMEKCRCGQFHNVVSCRSGDRAEHSSEDLIDMPELTLERETALDALRAQSGADLGIAFDGGPEIGFFLPGLHRVSLHQP